MNKLLKLALVTMALATPITNASAGENDDFGVWTEIGIKKNLPNGWNVGLETELRTEDNSSCLDRWSIGPNVGYRLGKYLKLNLGYNFLYSYKPEKTKVKDMEDSEVYESGYNRTVSHWIPKHRLYFDISPSVKIGKWIRLSLRERYQYTYKQATSPDRYKYREGKTIEKHSFLDGEPYFDENWNLIIPQEEIITYEQLPGKVEWDTNEEPAESNHTLRSRLKIELDKKRLAWGPFISVEFHNNLGAGMHFDKLRACVGTSYKFNRQHSLSFGYTLTVDREEIPVTRRHAISVGYEFEF